MLSAIFILSSCEDELTDLPEEDVDAVAETLQTDSESSNGIIQNPYEISFMQSILAQVRIMAADYNENNSYVGFDFDNLDLTPNYYYVKFSP